MSYSRFDRSLNKWVRGERRARVRFVFIRGCLPQVQVVVDGSDRLLVSHSLMSTYPLTAVFRRPRIVFASQLGSHLPVEKFSLTFSGDSSENSAESGFALVRKIISRFLACKDLDGQEERAGSAIPKKTPTPMALPPCPVQSQSSEALAIASTGRGPDASAISKYFAALSRDPDFQAYVDSVAAYCRARLAPNVR